MKREIVELREVVQKLVPLLTGKGLEVTQRGSQAYVRTDPNTRKPVQVNIPNISDNASDSFVRAVQGFIDHEVAHVLITDWNFYGGAPSQKDLARPEVQKLINVHNIIEDTMIEREIVKIFPGSKKNIADLRQHFINKVTTPAIANAKSPEEVFNYLMVPAMRALAGHVEFEEFMDKGGHWENPMIKKLVGAFDPQTLKDLKTVETTEQTLAIARELYDILYKKKEPESEQKGQSGQSQDKPEKKAESGSGTGERDHSETEAGEEEDDGDQSDGAPGKGKSKGGKQSGDEKDADDEAGGGSDNKDKPEASENEDGSDTDDSAGENAGDGDSEDDADESGDEEGSEDESSGDGADGDADQPADDGEDDADAKSESDDGDGGENSDESKSGDDADENDEDDGDESEQGSASSGVGENDSGGGDADEDAEQGEASVVMKTDGAVDESDPSGFDASDAESEGGSGVGSRAGKSMFEFTEDALEGRGIAEEIMVKISEEAADVIGHSQWSVFSREWDRIEPLEAPENINSKWVPQMEDEVRSMTGRMQKDIERIMASQSHVVNTPGHKRGRLHSPSLYRVSQGDPRVFTQKQEHRSKDTAVSLLVDNSGSMAGEKMRVGMLATYALSATLDRVKIAHEMLGFTTGGRNLPDTMMEALRKEYDASGINYDRTIPLVMPIYKSFTERLDATVKKRIAYAMNAQRGLSGNIDGECVMIAAERLAQRTEKRKVMLVLSDGQPAGGRKSGSHLKSTVEYLNTNGIETIGIGILTDAVKHYYKNHVVLHSVDSLPGQVMTEIKRLLA